MNGMDYFVEYDMIIIFFLWRELSSWNIPLGSLLVSQQLESWNICQVPPHHPKKEQNCTDISWLGQTHTTFSPNMDQKAFPEFGPHSNFNV